MLDYSEQPALTIYQIASFTSEEENKPLMNVLRRLGIGVCSGDLRFEPKNPFPDEFQDEWMPDEFEWNNFRGEWVTSPGDLALTALDRISRSVELDENMFLQDFRLEAVERFGSDEFPQGIGFFVEKTLREILSAIVIWRDDYCAWCNQLGIVVPEFWFGVAPSIEMAEAITENAESKQRLDAMACEIKKVIDEGTAVAAKAILEALAARENTPGSCVFKVITTDTGRVIHWKASSGIVKKLNEKALERRLDRLKNKLKP